MSEYPLRVIPEPAEGTASVLVTESTDRDFTFFGGDGDTDLLCGKCGRALARGMASRNQVQGVVFKCPGCQSFNLT